MYEYFIQMILSQEVLRALFFPLRVLMNQTLGRLVVKMFLPSQTKPMTLTQEDRDHRLVKSFDDANLYWGSTFMGNDDQKNKLRGYRGSQKQKHKVENVVIHFLMNGAIVHDRGNLRYASNMDVVSMDVPRKKDADHDYPASNDEKNATMAMPNTLEVSVDYRGSGGSSKHPYINSTAEDLVDDAVAFARHMKQQYPNANITLYGHSMGGAIATKAAKKMYDAGEKVFLVNDRSFSTLAAASADYSFRILQPIISLFLWLTRYDLDVVEDYRAIPAELKMNITAVNDHMLSHSALSSSLSPTERGLVVTTRSEDDRDNTHGVGIEAMIDASDAITPAAEIIRQRILASANFIVTKPVYKYNPIVFKAADFAQYCMLFCGIATGSILYLQYGTIDLVAAYTISCGTAVASGCLGTAIHHAYGKKYENSNITPKSVMLEASLTSAVAAGVSAAGLSAAYFLSQINVLAITEGTILYDFTASIHSFTAMNLPVLLETGIPVLILFTLFTSDIISAINSNIRDMPAFR